MSMDIWSLLFPLILLVATAVVVLDDVLDDESRACVFSSIELLFLVEGTNNLSKNVPEY